MEEQIVKIGRINKIFGNSGEVSLTLYDAFPPELNKEEPVFVSIDALTTPLFFGSFSRKGVSHAVAIFDDFDTQARARMLVNREIFLKVVDQEDASADVVDDEGEELYLEDFVGYTIAFETAEGKPLGKSGVITDFLESEFNPLFEVAVDGQNFLIPAHDDLIVSFKPRKQTLRMILPEGLLELNNAPVD